MKAALALSNAVRLAQVLLARKVDICLTGVPLVFTRLSSLLCRKTTYVAYIRSLLVNDGRGSTSDAVMAAVAPFLPQGLMAMLRPYACDQCYTVGTVTKDALVGMGLASSTVTVVGPISEIDVWTKRTTLDVYSLLTVFVRSYSSLRRLVGTMTRLLTNNNEYFWITHPGSQVHFRCP